MLGLVHGNEHGQFEVFVFVVERNARFRREDLVGLIHVHDVFVARYGPIGAKLADLSLVNRRFLPQALEELVLLIGLKQLGLRRI